MEEGDSSDAVGGIRVKAAPLSRHNLGKENNAAETGGVVAGGGGGMRIDELPLTVVALFGGGGAKAPLPRKYALKEEENGGGGDVVKEGRQKRVRGGRGGDRHGAACAETGSFLTEVPEGFGGGVALDAFSMLPR